MMLLTRVYRSLRASLGKLRRLLPGSTRDEHEPATPSAAVLETHLVEAVAAHLELGDVARLALASTRCRREALSTLSRVDFGWPVQRDPKPIVKALARSWTALRSASFGNLSSHLVTDDLAVYLLRKCRTLRVVEFWGCDYVTDAVAKAIARYLPGLEQVTFCECKLIGDPAARSLARRCSKLRELDLESCVITDDGLRAFEGKRLTDLESLGLDHLGSYTSRISDVSVVPIIQGTSGGLRFVHLTRSAVADATVEAIARNCPALENLGLFGCEAVTDASVVLLASGCPRLETLFLTSRRVSDRSIIPILQCCPQVRFLDLRGPELTDAFVEQLIRQPPWRMVAREYSRISIHNGPSRERLFAFHQLCHRNITIFVGEWELNRGENEWRCARYASSGSSFQPAPAPAPPTPGGFSSDESESTDEDDVVTVSE